MSHSHSVTDADSFFEVDAITREVINKTPKKITLIQYDHNSEIFTFMLPQNFLKMMCLLLQYLVMELVRTLQLL